MEIKKEKFTASQPEDQIEKCQCCGAKDLYLQKDFPRKIAIPIVVAGMIAVPWSYGISLLVVALIDLIIYRMTSWMLVCYKCHSEFRGFKVNSVHKEFDRHIDELYRYGE